MNIIEAIKSGKAYFRKNDSQRFIPGDQYDFTYDQVLADDWEVEPEAVTITEQQFNLAVQRTLHQMDPDEHGFWDKLRKNIGL